MGGKRKKQLFPDDLIGTDIFAFLGIGDISTEQKEQLLSIMLETIQDRVVSRVLNALTKEDERIEFEQALEEKNADQIDQLLLSSGLSGIAQLIAEEVMLYKLEIMNLFSQTHTNGVAGI